MVYDVILVGGGLFSALFAYRLKQLRPQVRVVVVEAGPSLGGHATWSFHHSDLSPSAFAWLRPLLSAEWAEQTVKFPRFERTLHTGYASIRSQDLDKKLRPFLSGGLFLNCPATDVAAHSVTTSTGVLTAETVLDARGFGPLKAGKSGYQIFGGWNLLLSEPHGLQGPLLMDAQVAQKEGFRFFYVLPWSSHEVLVEDTRYVLSGGLEESLRQEIRGELQAYVGKQGWHVRQRQAEEWGALPIPLVSGFREGGWGGATAVGVRGGFFHPTTGYSLPDSVRLIERLVALPELSAAAVYQAIAEYRRQSEPARAFFRFLNRMLFWGASPDLAYRVLERFYELPEGVIRRFYSGQLLWRDRVRLLWGKPPIPVWQAVWAHA